MRMATAGGAESAGRTGLAVGFHASDCAGLTPLAIVLVGFSPIRSRIDDDAVVAVAIGDVDTSRSTGDRIPCSDPRRCPRVRSEGCDCCCRRCSRYKWCTCLFRPPGRRTDPWFRSARSTSHWPPERWRLRDCISERRRRRFRPPKYSLGSPHSSHANHRAYTRHNRIQASYRGLGWDCPTRQSFCRRYQRRTIGGEGIAEAVASCPTIAPDSFPCSMPLTVAPTSHPRLYA